MKSTARKIVESAEAIRKLILAKRKPALRFPLRTLSNVRYRAKPGYLELRGKHKSRTLTVNTVKTFAQTLRMMSVSKELIETDDIVKYELPTHPLKDVDVKRARDALANDPFVRHHKPWQEALRRLVKMGVRAEQQALAKHGLNYVMETYLPEKLRNPKSFLP